MAKKQNRPTKTPANKKDKPKVEVIPEMKVTNKFTRKESDDFRKLILGRRNEILEDLGDRDQTLKQSQKEASGDISGYTYHMADVATDNYDREFSLGIASNERQMLYELDDALKRIDDNTYGLCEDCKAQISKTRLKAIPYTRRCLSCQEKRDGK
ncbi:MAG: TraR/DksA family transcriptional regulator [Deltaproteobacteria bacterium]